MGFSASVARIERLAGVSQPDAEAYLNTARDELVSAAEYLKVRSVMPTVSEQRLYDFPATAKKITDLFIEAADGTVVEFTEEISENAIRGLRSGRLVRQNTTTRFFARTTSENGRAIEIYPTYDVDDDDLCMVIVTTPAAMDAGNDDFDVPTEFISAIEDRAFALAYQRNEANARDAVPFDEKFNAAIGRLAALVNSDLETGAPFRIPVLGVDA